MRVCAVVTCRSRYPLAKGRSGTALTEEQSAPRDPPLEPWRSPSGPGIDVLGYTRWRSRVPSRQTKPLAGTLPLDIGIAAADLRGRPYPDLSPFTVEGGAPFQAGDLTATPVARQAGTWALILLCHVR